MLRLGYHFRVNGSGRFLAMHMLQSLHRVATAFVIAEGRQ